MSLWFKTSYWALFNLSLHKNLLNVVIKYSKATSLVLFSFYSSFLHSHFHANRSVMNGKLVNSEIEEVLHRMLNVDKYMHLCKATRYSTATSKYQVAQMPITWHWLYHYIWWPFHFAQLYNKYKEKSISIVVLLSVVPHILQILHFNINFNGQFCE